MELYMDEKWKLSKKSGGSSRREHVKVKSDPQILRRSSSLPPQTLKRSSSSSASSSSSTAPRPVKNMKVEKNSTLCRSSFSGRCASLVKEQRAKFYIVRRCVTMLICWRDYS